MPLQRMEGVCMRVDRSARLGATGMSVVLFVVVVAVALPRRQFINLGSQDGEAEQELVVFFIVVTVVFLVVIVVVFVNVMQWWIV